MKYCGQCGNRLGTGRFCSRCGAPVLTTADDAALPPGPPGPPPSARYPLYADGRPPGPTVPPPPHPPAAPRDTRPVDQEVSTGDGSDGTLERTSVRPPVIDETVVRRPDLRLVQDTAAQPSVPPLAETAVRPAIPRVDLAPERADDPARWNGDRPRGHSAWTQTFWAMVIVLLAVMVAGVWLLTH